MTVFPTLGPDGLPSWVRADLRAMPVWEGKNDLRTRRPITAVRKIPVRSAERAGAVAGPVSAGAGYGIALAVVVVALVIWRRL